MARLLLSGAQLLDPEGPQVVPGSLLLEDGRIAGRLASDARVEGAERVELGGRLLAPGFLDLHFHGRLVFAAPGSVAAALRDTAAELLRSGTTGFLATTVAWPAPELMTRVTELAEACDAASDAALGLHLEGPWIRPEAAGAQPRGGIRAVDPTELDALLARTAGRVRMVTLAPEVDGAGALVDRLVRDGIVAALGHSLADEGCVMRAVTRGARHVTHLFNAMGPLHHRERGFTGVALTEDRLSCDLICDGVHVHPAVVRLAARAKGERLLLITDRVEPGPAGWGAGGIREEGGALRLPDGTLAGSALTLDHAVRNARDFGALSLREAVASVTLRPARLLGLEAERGTLRAGARADLVVLGEGGRVEETWVAGRRVWAEGA